MARSLVIVESPAKARTINRYLGKDYVVKSSVGHVRDLPVGGQRTDSRERAREAARTRKLSPARKEEHKRRRARAQLVRRMGVDPDNGWQAEYEVLPGKDKVVSELRRLADGSEHVYLATDLDREGEAIAWHLQELIGGDPERFRRVVFNEITKPAIEAAFRDPGRIDENRVNAQQARRFLDRVVGFELSPLLWAKIARGLSAGRVQSVAVRLIVEREREIRAFVPEEYWEGFADLARPGSDEGHRFAVHRDGGSAFRPGNAEAAEAALVRLRAAEFVVARREDRPTTTAPSAPFITSTLQQAASTRLGFAVRKTMSLAQRLYEAGHITYMRTDSTNLSRPAVAAVREYIEEAYGKDYLSPRPAVYASKAAAQEAHEAIRPTNVRTTPDSLAALPADERRLYALIWSQFVACQMARARYLSTTVVVEGNGLELRARGRIMQFDGYTRVLAATARRDEDRPIPAFAEGERLRLVDAGVVQHFTKPPPRYGEASLVRELEKLGIGRPSTYAAIISTIQERGYVSLEKRRFRAERIGELVTDRLVENFADLMDYSFTAELEGELDRIAGGERGWRAVLDGFYEGFSDRLAKAGAAGGGMRANEPTDTDVPCDRCGRPMQIRTASTGVFLGCSGYRLPPKERCTNTLNLTPGDEVEEVEEDSERELDDLELLRSKRRCPKCGTPMDSYLIDARRKLHVCGNNPDCAGFEIEEGEFRIKGYDGPTLTCERCGAEMQLKSGRFGKYFGCTNDACSNTRKILRDGRPAPPRADPVPMPELACERVDDHFVLRDGAAGLFLAASQFPRNRETRAPLVRELKAHANELDPRFAYLLDAPEADPDGNPAALKWSRKTRQQFVASDRDGKPTTWRAHYRDGRWEQQTGSTGARKGGGRAAAKGGGRRRKR